MPASGPFLKYQQNQLHRQHGGQEACGLYTMRGHFQWAVDKTVRAAVRQRIDQVIPLPAPLRGGMERLRIRAR
jgi:hypothetical protein